MAAQQHHPHLHLHSLLSPFLLRRKDGNEDDGHEPGHEPEDVTKEEEEKLYCIRCGHLVTGGRWRITVGDDHEHMFFNPVGMVFRIGCFREAPGARPKGRPTGEFTWFAGYKWRIAVCAGCGTQLGWFYTGEGAPPAFFGLILPRLTTEKPDFPDSA